MSLSVKPTSLCSSIFKGPCQEVLDDLVEIGVDAVGASWLQMPLEELVPKYRDKLTFWAGLGGKDSSELTPEIARESVRRLRAPIDGSQGGLISRFVWAPRDYL